MSPKVCVASGATWAAIAIALGAFGAHSLEKSLPGWYPDPTTCERMRQTWETAVRYQCIQALGLVLLGVWAERNVSRKNVFASVSMLGGSIIFSGLLYALVLTGQRGLGAIVPIGGILMILGWILWAIQAAGEPQAAFTPSSSSEKAG